ATREDSCKDTAAKLAQLDRSAPCNRKNRAKRQDCETQEHDNSGESQDFGVPIFSGPALKIYLRLREIVAPHAFAINEKIGEMPRLNLVTLFPIQGAELPVRTSQKHRS